MRLLLPLLYGLLSVLGPPDGADGNAAMTSERWFCPFLDADAVTAVAVRYVIERGATVDLYAPFPASTWCPTFRCSPTSPSPCCRVRVETAAACCLDVHRGQHPVGLDTVVLFSTTTTGCRPVAFRFRHGDAFYC